MWASRVGKIQSGKYIAHMNSPIALRCVSILCCLLFSGSLAVRGVEGSAALPKTFAEFEKSAVSGATVPLGLSEPLKVMWHSKAGQWKAGHDIAETLKTKVGSWVHAFLHREEGDRGNAGYWYRRAGMTLPAEGVALADEWQLISRELWQREFGVVAGEEALTSPGGLTATSVMASDGAEGSWDTLVRKDSKEVLRIPRARPVSFSPVGEVLLLVEAAADDDLRHILVRPSADLKVPPFGERKRIGGRGVSGHQWADDGLSLTLTSLDASRTVSSEKIQVSEQVISSQPTP